MIFLVEIDPKSIGVIERKSKRFFLRYRAASNKTLKDGMEIVRKLILKNISRKDYGPSDFEKMDHPYAKRHGRILTGKLKFPYNNNMPYLIHQQSGKLKKDFKIKKIKKDGTAKVFFEDSTGYTHYVTKPKGTPKMFGRDVISGTLAQKGIQQKLQKLALKNFKSVIKSYGK